MSEEKAVKLVRFSLPFRPGMESKAGYKEKVEGTSKTYPDEKEFAKFEFPLDTSIVVTDAEAIAFGRPALQQNKQRTNLIGAYAKDFKIAAPGAAGITKTDKNLIAAMGELTQNHEKIAAAFSKKTGKAITKEEVAEILVAAA